MSDNEQRKQTSDRTDEKIGGNSRLVHRYRASAGDVSHWMFHMLTRTLPLVFIAGFFGVYLVWYVPLILIAIITVILLGYIYGSLLRATLEKSNCRRKIAVHGSLILTIAFAWWCNWVIWADLYLNQSRQVRIDIPLVPVYNLNLSITDPMQLGYLLTHPARMLEFLDVTYDNGLFSIFSRKSSGGESWFFWLLELGGFYMSALANLVEVYEVPYSSMKRAYYDKTEMIVGYFDDVKGLKESLLRGDCLPLQAAVRGDKRKSHALLTLYRSDGETSYVSLVNKKSKEHGFLKNTEDEEVVTHLCIDEETAESLLRLATVAINQS